MQGPIDHGHDDPLPFEADPEREALAATIRAHLWLQRNQREQHERERSAEGRP